MAHDNTKKQSSSLFGDKPYSTVAALVLAVFGTAAAVSHLESDSLKGQANYKASSTVMTKESKATKPANLSL